MFSLPNFSKIFIAENLNWRVHLARIKYHELVAIYKSKNGYEKYKGQRYYNLSKPFGKIAYREKKQYYIAIKELKSILKLYPKLGIDHFGLALSYGLLGLHKKEFLFYKKAFDINPEFKNFLPMRQRNILNGQLND